MTATSLTILVCSYLAGYAFSVLLGNVVIKPLLDRFYLGYEAGRTVENWRAGVVGIVERALYTSALLLGSPEFIAIWLALKVAGQWDRWKQDWSAKAREEELKDGRDTARAMYSGYLVGNALSLSYGVIGALIVQAGLAHEWGRAVTFPLALLGATALLFLHIRKQTRHHTRQSRSRAA
jgi:hypothetical protein